MICPLPYSNFILTEICPHPLISPRIVLILSLILSSSLYILTLTITLTQPDRNFNFTLNKFPIFILDGNVVRQLAMDNRRQNFGTVVTTEGMWMIGGLFESASDLPTRKISKRFNIPGK